MPESGRAFFRARRFADIEHDLPRQLMEWLVEIDEERPSRATGVIPAERLAIERSRMKPLAIPPAEYGLRFPVQVGPTALVDFQGIRYAMPAGACGIPATLFLYPDRVRIETGGGRFAATHPRFPQAGRTSYLAGQRAEQLAAVAGARKRLYFMRERLLELGPVGEGYLTELIHARPFTWKADVERLFMLLEELGENQSRQPGFRDENSYRKSSHHSATRYRGNAKARWLSCHRALLYTVGTAGFEPATP